jgi:hypothetical protein
MRDALARRRIRWNWALYVDDAGRGQRQFEGGSYQMSVTMHGPR